MKHPIFCIEPLTFLSIVLTEEIHKIVFFTLTQPFLFSILLYRFYLYVQVPELGSQIPNNFTPFFKIN